MRATCQDLAVTPGACEAVHTAAVCPGFVDTPMLREHLGWAGAGAEEEKVWHSKIPPRPSSLASSSRLPGDHHSGGSSPPCMPLRLLPRLGCRGHLHLLRAMHICV
jgi:hypothetical protein